MSARSQSSAKFRYDNMDNYIENIYNYPIEKIPYLHDVYFRALDIHSTHRKKNKMKTLKTSTFGTNNVVSIIQINDKKKYAVRLSKNPIDLSTPDLRIIQSKINWNKANSLKICPRVIYNGYFKIKTNTAAIRIHELLITDAYDTDLHSYYADKITPDNNDAIICDKLRQQLYTLASNSMWVSCLDIKPANIVCNISTSDPRLTDVRLIDLDGDWCTLIPESIQTIDTTIGVYFETCIFMACHFLLLGNNIFADYMQTFSKAEIYELLHQRLAADRTHLVYWVMIANHYFKDFDKLTTNVMDVSYWLTNLINWSQMKKINEHPSPIALTPTQCKYRDPIKKKCVSNLKFKNHIFGKTRIAKPKILKPCAAGKERNYITNRCRKRGTRPP